MQEVWKIAIGIAGLGAVAAFVVWSLYSKWLELGIFQRLTKKQQYRLFLLFFWLTFCFALAALVTYIVVDLGGRSQLDDKTLSYTVELKHNDILLREHFELTYTAPAIAKHTEGLDGKATISLPSRLRTVDTIRINVPCYVQSKTGPFQLVEGKPVIIDLRKVMSPDPEPIPPTAYPNPKNVIPPDAWPSNDDVSAIEVRDEAMEHVLEYENDSGEFVYLLLFNFARAKRDLDPWRVLPSDPCVDVKRFSGFEEANGLFALIVLAKDFALPEYLGVVDLYAKKTTRLRIIKDGTRFVGQFR